MTDPQTLAVIDRLERARRLWKRLALGALAALLVVCSLGVSTIISQWQQVRAEHERAEQALREAEAQKDQARRALYVSQVALAEREFADASRRQEHRP
jgi:hypothetical protein